MPKSRVASIRTVRPVYLAAFSAALFFAVGAHKLSVTSEIFVRHALFSALFFACVWGACRLFAAGIDRRLQLEGYTKETAGDMIYTFVIYMEMLKHVVGFSFTVGWIAGVMASWEFLGDRMLLVPIGSSLAVSLIAFAITCGFSAFTDQVRWPVKDED
ncbi:MAG: hypothetical protein RQ723_04690 [Desulfuromonadales bacterium]|nr:hypothetical protein [Desulfuromonadales bacterium]